MKTKRALNAYDVAMAMCVGQVIMGITSQIVTGRPVYGAVASVIVLVVTCMAAVAVRRLIMWGLNR